MSDHFVCFSLLTKSSIKYKSTTYNGFLDLLNIYIFSSCDGPSKCTMQTAQVNLIEGEKREEIDARLDNTGGDGGGSWDLVQP